ncbi:MAG TPA: bifunctional glycosyltransferase family 2/GtrA family protein [Acidimicrobiia bacterium]
MPTSTDESPRDARAETATPTVDIVVPVHNEAKVLEANIGRLRDYLVAHFPVSWRITIVDSGSDDGTGALAADLAEHLPGVRTVRVDRPGRGRALRAAWQASDAAVVAYTDVDLSTDLSALLPLVAPLISGHSDIAIGSRLLSGSEVARGPKRELISRLYNLMLRVVFASRVRDAQCGFKAIRADVVGPLLDAVTDQAWFFDTELLLLAEHNGLRIHELPVNWVDDSDSRVRVVPTAVEDLRGAVRMAWRFVTGRGRIEFADAPRGRLGDDFGRRIVRFGVIGLLSTAVSLAIFLALRDSVGAIAANAIAVTATFLGNTWANRHFVVGGGLAERHWRGALAVWLGALAVTSAGLGLVDAVGGGLTLQLVALAVTWTGATVARLALIRTWVLRADA